MSAKVTARGHGVARAEPDEVELQIAISALERSSNAALAEATRLDEALHAVLFDLEIPTSARSTQGLFVREEREWEDSHYVHRGYRAGSTMSIKLADPTLAGRLLLEATERAQARVDGPWWRVAADNPARVEACRLAAADARRKAEGYAQALGARLGAILAIAEPSAQDQPVYASMKMAVAESSGEMQVEAGELDIHAVVDVTFALEQH